MKDLVLDLLVACGRVAESYKVTMDIQPDLEIGEKYQLQQDETLVKIEAIVNGPSSQATKSFVKGLQNFYEENGYLSDSQAKSLINTYNSMQM